MAQYLYMAVTADEYELPLCVEDRIKALASRYNLNASGITSALKSADNGLKRGVRFVKVPHTDYEDDLEITYSKVKQA